MPNFKLIGTLLQELEGCGTKYPPGYLTLQNPGVNRVNIQSNWTVKTRDFKNTSQKRII